jgi:hypothetical protein
MPRNWGQWILSDEFKERVSEAVREAVAESKAAGLPPSYWPDYGVPDRRAAVEQMNTNARLSGFEPSAQDLENQRRYIMGELSLDDLLSSAREFALAAAQQPPTGK